MSTELVEIYHALKRRTPVVLTTVIASRGSTPRAVGSKMIVYGDGATSGTIGGGAIEGDVTERALQIFATKQGAITAYDLWQDGRRSELDLVCGGTVEILLEYVDICNENERLYDEARERIEKEQPFLWIVGITEAKGGILLERLIRDIPAGAEGQRRQSSITKSGEELVFVEPVLPARTAYIVGAGHVGKELARLTRQIGMKTLVFDDRPEFATVSRFPDADGVHVCEEYAKVFESHVMTPNSCVIIVTRGHSYDREVLGQALKTPAGYIGMMGSRKKRATIYTALLAAGFSAEALNRVHCPIGLPIRAETPAELAVSIAAELIDHCASQDVQD